MKPIPNLNPLFRTSSPIPQKQRDTNPESVRIFSVLVHLRSKNQEIIKKISINIIVGCVSSLDQS